VSARNCPEPNINILPGGNVETGFSVGCVGAEDDSLK